MKNFILRGHVCYSADLHEITVAKYSYVVCADGICQGVYEKLPDEYKSFPIYDYGNRIIIPGFVDLHIHAPQYAYRGLGMDLELLDWLDKQAFPEEEKYDDINYAEAAYSIFADQMKKSATTHACIFGTRHRQATETLMELMEETGLVTYIGKVNMDRNCPDRLREASAELSAQETEKWINETQNLYKRTRQILTPRFIPSCTDELLERISELQKKYDLPVQSHLSENRDEIAWVKTLCPDSRFYGDAYKMHGLFGGNVKTVMAHCVYSTDEEMNLMRKNGVFVAHCPASNLNLSSGIAPIRKYLDAGVHIGLGSDVAGGQTESIFKAMVDAIQVSKMYWRLVDSSCMPITFEEAFFMATKGGGEFFGKVGSFEKGYEFNAVVIDDSDLPYPQKLKICQRLERIVYLSFDIKGIHAKYAAGKKIF